MRPFQISNVGRAIVESYPPAEIIRTNAPRLPYQEILGFLRLWITEGIPYCFREAPMLYEMLREWLGRQLGTDPKSVTIIGSGRIGYSLAPPPQFGSPFTPQSDLDFSVIAEPLFDRLSAEFYRWRADTLEGRAQPQNATQRSFWEVNQRDLPRSIARGFLDPHKIPLRREYATAQRIGQALWLMQQKLKITPGAPNVRKVTLRVYTNWSSFLRLLNLNLDLTLRSMAPRAPETRPASN